MAWKFQSRRKNSGNNGDDFEDFVFETLRIAKGEHGLAKKLARGRDGAIDLIDRKSAPGATAVVECKYIGSAEAKAARGRWAEVYKNLSNNLPNLWIDPSKTPLSPYRDWLNPDSPVTSYRFCVTATMSEPELTALEDQIKTDFASLFKQGIEPLRTLAESPGAIQVLRWDWFVAELDSAPSLAYRWFSGLPVGVELLDPARDAQASFRAFLHSDALPYFSRDQFRQAESGAVNNSEAALVDQLLNGQCQALLISGPGGAGKTRLSLELAQALAASAESFDVYRLERSATREAILELATAYPGDGAIAFVVDYAESVTDLAGVADAVHHLAENGGHKIRLIATCRASASTQVRDALEAIDPQMLDMGSAQTGEEAFANWVVRSILAVGPAPLAGELDRVCHGLPGLAAFALYLYRYHRSRFDAQFGTLHGLDDFGKWARHRIAMLVSGAADRSAEEAWLARLALAMPLSAEQFETLRAERPSLAESLLTDRWIEPDGDMLVAAHDVLADVLVANWLFSAANRTTTRALELLAAAANEARLPSALIALDRLGAHAGFAEIDGLSVARALIDHHPDQARQCCGLFLGGVLLGLEQKLDLLHTSPLIRDTAKAPEFDIVLSFLADGVVRRKIDRTLPALITLVDMLDAACDRRSYSNLILRRSYALNPDRFRARVQQALADFPEHELSHFLLAQMLKSGEPADGLEAAVKRWLTANATEWRASFVYRAWLDAEGEVAAVSDAVLAWIGTYGQTPEARFVFAAWLDAKGEIAVVSDAVLAWIGTYGQAPEARFVFAAWLDATGDIAAVSDAVLTWIGTYGQSPEASFVYPAWLDAKGEIAVVSDAVLDWIGTYGQTPEASFVYCGWLEAKGEIAAVSEAVLAWIGTYGQTPEAGFVYAAWLNAKGEIAAVSDAVLAWIGTNGQAPKASFVYCGWLDAKGEIAAVSAAVLAWIGTYGQMPKAQFVYRGWLDAKGEIAAVSDAVLAWIGTYGQTPEARFVFAAWLDAKGEIAVVSDAVLAWTGTYGQLPEAGHVYRAWLDRTGGLGSLYDDARIWIGTWKDDQCFAYFSKSLAKRRDLSPEWILAISGWCSRFRSNEDCLFRLVDICRAFGEPTLSIGEKLLLFQNVEDALDHQLSHAVLLPVDRTNLWAIAGTLARSYVYSELPPAVERMVAAMVSGGKIFAPDLSRQDFSALESTYQEIGLVARNALQHGQIDAARHRDQLLKFVDWLRGANADQEVGDLVHGFERVLRDTGGR